MIIRPALIVLWFLAGISALIAQAVVEKPQIQRTIEYEVIRSDNAHVTAREGCFGLKYLTVYVIPPSALEEKIDTFAREIGRTFPEEYDLIIEFTIDRTSTIETSSDEEDLWLRNLRGFYIRSKGKNIDKMFTFPNGTSRDELEKLFEIDEN